MDNFKVLDLNTWNRRDYFYYFTKMMPTAYSITIDIDVTNTYQYLKTRHLKFFPSYLYITTRLLKDQPEFLIGERDGQVVQYEQLHPSFSLFHADDHSISNLWVMFSDQYQTFYDRYVATTDQYHDQHGAMVQSDPTPVNSFMIGTIPWLSFNSYTPLPLQPLKTYFPIIQSGQFKEIDGRKMMPLSFTIHHAVADGYHVSQYLNRLKTAFAQPEQWITIEV